MGNVQGYTGYARTMAVEGSSPSFSTNEPLGYCYHWFKSNREDVTVFTVSSTGAISVLTLLVNPRSYSGMDITEVYETSIPSSNLGRTAKLDFTLLIGYGAVWL